LQNKNHTGYKNRKKPDVKAHHMFASRGRCAQFPTTALKKTHVAIVVMHTTNTTYTHH